MSDTLEGKRLDAFVEEYQEEESDGMALRILNTEGGGNNVPDEDEFYETRREWLEETEGGKSKIWRTLAEGELDGMQTNEDEDEELVYLRVPAWYTELDDNKDWSRTLGEVYGWFEGWAILKPEMCEDKNAWCFSKFYINNRWISPHSEYGMLWGARSCMSVFRREGEPRPLDAARIRKREALPDGADPWEAEEDDYDWRLALGAAYRRTEGSENDPLSDAYDNAQELPEKLYNKVEIGVNEYMEQAAAEGQEVDEDDLAMVVNALTAACSPSSTTRSED